MWKKLWPQIQIQEIPFKGELYYAGLHSKEVHGEWVAQNGRRVSALKIFKTQMEMALSNLLWAGELDYIPADSLSTSITLW